MVFLKLTPPSHQSLLRQGLQPDSYGCFRLAGILALNLPE
jgi:hypothetical protein